MALLTDAELAHLRMVQEGAMPDTCTLRSVTVTNDGSGGWCEGTSDVAEVPCRFSFQSGSERIAGQQQAGERTYVISVPVRYALTPKMRVIKDGSTYEVVAVNENASLMTTKRATLMRLG
jgi:SPP1 family predicted phage head-tail adaptor